MTTRKYELKYMTWKETDEAFKTNPVVIIPLGSMEVHGPHSPTGDYLIAEEVAKRAAGQTGAYCTPVVPFGHSEYFRAFPGTISVSTDTLYSWVNDICTSLTEHGVTKILLLNGHAGNSSILEYLARRIRREQGIMLGKLDMWQTLSPEVQKEVYGEDYKTIGHGGGPVDTVMKFLYPNYMRMDLIKEEKRNEQWQQFPISGLGKTTICGSTATIFYNMEDISPQGLLGNPYIGDAIGGEKLLNRMVECCVDFVKKMQASDMVLK